MVLNLFGDVLSRSFNVIGQLMKTCWLLLFSIKTVIGQFSSKWPGPSSRTVIYYSKNYFNLGICKFECFGYHMTVLE